MFDFLDSLWQGSWLDQAFDGVGDWLDGSGADEYIGFGDDAGKTLETFGNEAKDSGGFFDDLFSAKTLGPSLLGLGSKLYEDSQTPSFEEKLEQQKQLGALNNEQYMERLKAELELKKSLGLLGGGGGSSGPNYGEQNKQLKYKGMLDALGGAAEGSLYGANTLNNAYANLLGALKR